MMTISRIQILDIQKVCSPDEIWGADLNPFAPRISSGLHHERHGLSFYTGVMVRTGSPDASLSPRLHHYLYNNPSLRGDHFIFWWLCTRVLLFSFVWIFFGTIISKQEKKRTLVRPPNEVTTRVHSRQQNMTSITLPEPTPFSELVKGCQRENLWWAFQ